MAKKAKKTVKAKKAGAKWKQTAVKSATKKKVTKSKPVKAKKATAAKKSRSAEASKPKRKPIAPRKQQANTPHPGMMGDGTEEQNLNQTGNPGARITQDEIDAAFKKPD